MGVDTSGNLTMSGGLVCSTNGIVVGTRILSGDTGGVEIITAPMPTPYDGHLALVSNNSQAAGYGGTLTFRGCYVSTSDTAAFAAIKGYKANSTNGNYEGKLTLYVREHGASLNNVMTLDYLGNMTLVGKILESGGGQTSTHSAYGGMYLNPNAATVEISCEASGGQEIGMFAHSNGNCYMGSFSQHPLIIRVYDTNALTFATDTSATFAASVKASGGYKSSDGTDGLTNTMTFTDAFQTDRSIVIKNGLIVSIT